MPIENLEERLAKVQDAFNNAPADGGRFEMPPDGEYQAIVDSFDFFEASDRAFFKTVMTVQNDDDYEGRRIETVHGLDDPDKIAWLKQHLATLGVAVDDLDLTEIRPGSQTLANVLDTPVLVSVKTSARINEKTEAVPQRLRQQGARWPRPQRCDPRACPRQDSRRPAPRRRDPRGRHPVPLAGAGRSVRDEPQPVRLVVAWGRKPRCSCGSCDRCRKNAYMREYYRALSPEDRKRVFRDGRDIDRVRAADRERYERAKNDPDSPFMRRRRAILLLNQAIRRGEIQRQPCEICRTPDAHGHHDDYDRPLDVRWCAQHHADEHRSVAA